MIPWWLGALLFVLGCALGGAGGAFAMRRWRGERIVWLERKLREPIEIKMPVDHGVPVNIRSQLRQRSGRLHGGHTW
jgi:hypothetical protein